MCPQSTQAPPSDGQPEQRKQHTAPRSPLFDPSGNVIEIKSYPNPASIFAWCSATRERAILDIAAYGAIDHPGDRLS